MKKSFKIYKAFIDTFTLIVGFVFAVSVSALDSDTWIPFLTLLISGAWLVLYAWAHGWFIGGDEK